MATLFAPCYWVWVRERERNVLFNDAINTFYLWLRTILIVRKETRCCHIGYSYLLTARVLLYAPSHRQDNTYHGLCYTSCGVLAGPRNSSMGPPHEGSIWRPTAPWANALTTELLKIWHTDRNMEITVRHLKHLVATLFAPCYWVWVRNVLVFSFACESNQI